MNESIVVVGAGQAGAWAARTLREQGHEGPIVLLGDERHAPYERPPLSKDILAGSAAPEAATIFSAAVLGQLAIDWRAPVTCTAIHRDERKVLLSDGSALAYDKLILCTGGRARPLPVPGADLPGVFSLRSLDDAAAIASRLEPGKRLVAIGGGWIGLEVAATARLKGMEVSVVEAEARLCARSVPPQASSYLLSLHERHGAQVLLNCSVEQIEHRADGGLAVVLKEGRVLAADIFVVGIGLLPNDELARDAGLECRGGIIVDAQCRTSDERIFAAGDVTLAHNQWYRKRLRLESWQNAQDQGIAVAKAALGMDIRYDPLPRFWSDQYDIRIQMLGCPGSERGVPVVREDPASGRFMVFCVDDARLLGVLSINAAADLREARRILMTGRPVSVDALGDPAFDLASV
jgi:3-phenylpropionate/trans-cinnamate dioxygenase ferredoxin reductase subunit